MPLLKLLLSPFFSLSLSFSNTRDVEREHRGYKLCSREKDLFSVGSKKIGEIDVQ